MIALFEGGNSRLHSGWWDGGMVRGTVHSAYPDHPDGLGALVRGFAGESVPERIVACSVSSRHGGALFAALEALVPGRVTVIRTAADIGVAVRYDHPECYGIDRALAAFAAHSRFQCPCVVIDAGTAVTVDAVDADGTVIGGYIFPGAETLTHGLATRTALPEVAPAMTGGGPGNSTDSCIARGIAEGLAGAVRRLCDRAVESLGTGSRVIVTGGGGKPLLDALPAGTEYSHALVLEGLGRVAERVR